MRVGGCPKELRTGGQNSREHKFILQLGNGQILDELLDRDGASLSYLHCGFATMLRVSWPEGAAKRRCAARSD
jgi:hypothetical protein